MATRMGSELLDTDVRFNEYRRLNAFSDINQKLEADVKNLTNGKKKLGKLLEIKHKELV
jgi:hypothetical protein